MTDNLRIFPGETTLNFEPNVILDGAKRANLSEVVIVGMDQDGAFYFASNIAAGPGVLWLLELAKTRLIAMGSE